jgi:propanediol utilization protein
MEIHPRFIVERSANHIHLSEKDAAIIFSDVNGFFLNDYIETFKPLSIKGEYNTTIKVYSQEMDSTYTLLYPFREYSQIEVSMSDYYRRFKEYPKRVNSGELEGARTVYVRGVEIPIIVVKPHVHLNKKYDIKYIKQLNFPFDLTIKVNDTIDGINRIHLDIDQYAAIQ